MSKNKKNEFEVIFYRDINKKSRVIEFLNALDLKMHAKVMMSVGILEKNGQNLENHLQNI